MGSDQIYLSFLGHFKRAEEYERKYEKDIVEYYNDFYDYDYDLDDCNWEYSVFGKPDYDFWILNNVHIRIWHIENDVYRVCVKYSNGLEAAFVRLAEGEKESMSCCEAQPHGSYCRTIETLDELLSLG